MAIEQPDGGTSLKQTILTERWFSDTVRSERQTLDQENIEFPFSTWQTNLLHRWYGSRGRR